MPTTYGGILKDCIDKMMDEDYSDELLDTCEKYLKKLFIKINTKGMEKLSKLELYFIGVCFDIKMYSDYKDWINIGGQCNEKVQEVLYRSNNKCVEAQLYYEGDDFEDTHFRLKDFVRCQIENYKYVKRNLKTSWDD